MKYFKYVFGLFLVLFSLTLFIPSVEAQGELGGFINYNVVVESYGTIDVDTGYVRARTQLIEINPDVDTFFVDLHGISYNLIEQYQEGSQLLGTYISLKNASNNELTRVFLDNNSLYANVSSSTIKYVQIYFAVAVPPQATNLEKQQIRSGLTNYFNQKYETNQVFLYGIIDGFILNYASFQDLLNTQYQFGKDNGFDEGYDEARNKFGYNDNGTIISGQGAYDKGYLEATKDSGTLKMQIINFVPGVLGSIFMFFFQLGQIGILGITILDILGILVLISGLIFLIKFFF